MQKVRNYANYYKEMPWNKKTLDKINLNTIIYTITRSSDFFN